MMIGIHLTPAVVWSLTTFATTSAGLWVGSQNPRWGWYYGIVHQALWLVEGYATGRYGDILLSLVFWVFYIRALRRFRGTRFEPAARQRQQAADWPCTCGAARRELQDVAA